MMTGFQRLTMAAYRAAPAIARSDLWRFWQAPTPQAYRWEADLPAPLPYDVPEHYRHGTALHLYFLEPLEYSRLTVTDLENKSKGEGVRERVKSFAAEVNELALLVVAPGFQLLLDDLNVLLHDGHHETARAIIEDPDRTVELSGFWQDEETGCWLKIRPDLIGGSGRVWDLKMEKDLRKPFSTHLFDRGYHWQAAMILDGLTAITGIPHEDFGNVVFYAPKEGPVDIGVYRYPQEAIDIGRERYRAALRQYAVCQADDVWPGQPDEEQEIVVPNYLKRRKIYDY
ncbi:MAG: PD-(D/E)XK nuclease-like domain-containing protein [bacterium]